MLLYYQLFWTYMADLPIFFRLTSLALGQSFDCPSASEVSLKDMGKIAVCLTRRKHNLINSLKFYTYFTINLYLLLKMFCDSYLYIMLSCFSWLYPKGSRREITTTHCLDAQSLPTKVKFVIQIGDVDSLTNVFWRISVCCWCESRVLQTHIYIFVVCLSESSVPLYRGMRHMPKQWNTTTISFSWLTPWCWSCRTSGLTSQ